MLFALSLPRIHEQMTTAVIQKVHAREGLLLPVGGALLDLTVDLSAVAAHDCPPVSRFRIGTRDGVWLRRVDVREGDEIPVGSPLALLSTEMDETLAGPVARALRVSIAAIMPQGHWLDDEA